MIYRDVVIYGVFLPGLLVVAIAALVASLFIRRLAARVGLARQVWHPELFNLAIFVLLLTTLARVLP
ncbi:DUF1656 domain-containing protein [Rhizobium grahamii]|uniref:DUF1656 domain-containing protein n=1 Tax=Rhizobium grahamii TaxID=1120045 RepID=UPI001FD38A15|nr:DUF1656 domain-containing protein [Rhizobium grahamii]